MWKWTKIEWLKLTLGFWTKEKERDANNVEKNVDPWKSKKWKSCKKGRSLCLTLEKESGNPDEGR